MTERLHTGVILVIIACTRTIDAKPLMRWTDTAVVESTVRGSVLRPPSDLLLAATEDGRLKGGLGSAGKHGKGFRHKSSSEGNDGYKKFDAFHTKSGDKYGYEEHTSFGKKKKKGDTGGDKHDGYGAASHVDVDVFKGASRVAVGPRFQSLKDISGDAFTVDGAKYRRGLQDDDGDLFFVFSGGANAAEGNQEGQQEGDHAQQQEGDDDGEHVEDDGEGAEQQEASDDDDESGQQQQRQEDDDYDY